MLEESNSKVAVYFGEIISPINQLYPALTAQPINKNPYSGAFQGTYFKYRDLSMDLLDVHTAGRKVERDIGQ